MHVLPILEITQTVKITLNIVAFWLKTKLHV